MSYQSTLFTPLSPYVYMTAWNSPAHPFFLTGGQPTAWNGPALFGASPPECAPDFSTLTMFPGDVDDVKKKALGEAKDLDRKVKLCTNLSDDNKSAWNAWLIDFTAFANKKTQAFHVSDELAQTCDKARELESWKTTVEQTRCVFAPPAPGPGPGPIGPPLPGPAPGPAPGPLPSAPGAAKPPTSTAAKVAIGVGVVAVVGLTLALVLSPSSPLKSPPGP